TNIENADPQGLGTGTEDRQSEVEITEVPGTDTETEDRQLSDKNLSDHVQLMKLDPQFEQSEVAKGPGKDIKRPFDEERQ
ncbi:2472_t:CDS:2, partial [Gigaspora rosea]